MAEKSVYDVLSHINVNEHTEKKGAFTYLSWAWAWGKLKEYYPNSTYRVYENADGWNYHTDNSSAWVKVGVTVEGEELIEYYPITDYKNNSYALPDITSRIVNDAIQRGLVKCIARHGLGLYIYAKEDIPESDPEEEAKKKAAAEAVLKAKREEVKKELKNVDVNAICKLYKRNSLDDFSLKECDNVLTHLDKIIEKYSINDEVGVEQPQPQPQPEASETEERLPQNLSEAIVVPCSLTAKDVVGKTMGELFGEGQIDRLNWIANDYKGKNEAMRKAAQIILTEAAKN